MTGALVLPARLDLPAAGPLAADLRAMARKPLAIDASGVVHLGALGLQVLLAAARDRAAGGLPMRIEAPSAPFLDALAIFGVSLADLTPETRT